MLTKTEVPELANYRDVRRHCDFERYIELQHYMQRAGVYFHPNQFEPMFLSTAHTPADIATRAGSAGTRSPEVSGTLTGADILSPCADPGGRRALSRHDRRSGRTPCVLGPDEFAKAARTARAAGWPPRASRRAIG